MSYAPADRTWGEWVAWQLEDVGYRVLIEAWDLLPGSNRAEWLYRHASVARQTISIITDAYLASEVGRFEWLSAWTKDPLGLGNKLLALKTTADLPSTSLDQIVPLDLFGLSEKDARHRLLSAVQLHPQGRSKPSKAPQFPPSAVNTKGGPKWVSNLPSVWNVPPRNPNFVGRDSHLDALCLALTRDRQYAVALCGMGGVGKTNLAIEYCYRYASEYAIVWWVSAEQPELINEHLTSLATYLGLVDRSDVSQSAEAVRDELRRRHDWLIVFDNAEQPSDIRNNLMAGSGRIIVTSRNPRWSSFGRRVDVGILSRDEATQLLLRRIPEIDSHTAEVLAAELGDLPLALEQASSYIEETTITPNRYLDIFRTQSAELLTRGNVDGYPWNLDTVWSLSLDRLRDMNPAALHLLQVCAFLAPTTIPLSLLAKSVDPSFIDHTPTLACEIATFEIVGVLVRYGLATRLSNGLQIHRMVQIATRERMSHRERLDTASSAGETIISSVPNDSLSKNEIWARWQDLLPHVLVLTRHRDLAHDPLTAARLSNCAAVYLHDRADLEASSRLLEQALKLVENTSESTDLLGAEILVNLGRVLRDQGRPLAARRCVEQALVIREECCGPESLLVADALLFLGHALRDSGESQAACDALERAVRIREGSLGPHHPDVADVLMSHGFMLRDIGEYGHARTLHERALGIALSTYGGKHPRVATALVHLGGVLRVLGELERSRDLLEQALRIDEQVYGPDHPWVAAALIHIGRVLLDLGRLDEAGLAFERALKIREQTFGPTHPWVAASLVSLSSIPIQMADFGYAKNLLDRALDIDERVYGKSHPWVASTLARLGHVSDQIGNKDDARRYLKRAVFILENRFGSDHPRVAKEKMALAAIGS
ncbi:FxSxx-COOH system tetratricopeptide repeat protein [Frankia sp. AgW1.1]|uniref:FxSxx-COOH system tetratricopeptide repeat protein n=1 Tax=Frankia sp. AgW1.1 TaxID=1836971 RepID=UPI001A531921|nr:tetratricopeptide repeat protein [Frankia sp. AgW1.1]MBL7625164.1 tetratricopeptide repeat protein [Frankia sp. AgB1.8]